MSDSHYPFYLRQNGDPVADTRVGDALSNSVKSGRPVGRPCFGYMSAMNGISKSTVKITTKAQRSAALLFH